MTASKSTQKKSAENKAKPSARRKASRRAANQKITKKVPTKSSSKTKPDFAAAFAALRGLLESFKPEIVTQADKPGDYHTEIPGLFHRKKPLYFAGIKTGKNYVSFHLLPVYFSPDLQQGMSPGLKKRMQGKACFNFTAVDDECFAELKELTAAGLKKFQTEGFRQQLARMQ